MALEMKTVALRLAWGHTFSTQVFYLVLLGGVGCARAPHGPWVLKYCHPRIGHPGIRPRAD